MSSTSVIVFLGPSLKQSEAERILSDAIFLPPVKCGDVLRAIRLQPKIIVIIDGYFEAAAAVWHKEILFALERGIAVYGAASMGALRAAELYTFGMQGIGTIFHWYQTGTINDDDEVALLHSKEQSNFVTISDAMVNIRATLAAAVATDAIDIVTADTIINTLKAQPYQQRNLQHTLTQLAPSTVTKIMATFVDQKKNDALQCLYAVQQALQQYNKSTATVKVARSIFFRGLHNDVMCRPFHACHKNLPITERVAMAARLMGENYRLVRRLAYLWSALNAIASHHAAHLANVTANATFFPSLRIDTMWLTANECTAVEAEQLQARVALVNQFLHWQLDLGLPGILNVEDFVLKWQHILNNNSSNLLTGQEASLRQQLLYYNALFWRAIEIDAGRLQLEPTVAQVQTFTDQFRKQHNLLSKEATMQWLEQRQLDVIAFTDLMLRLTRFRFLVMQHNLDVFGVWQDNPANVWWLLDMLRLTGCYPAAKAILLDDAAQQQAKAKLLAEEVTTESDAFNLDFYGGLHDLMTYAAAPGLVR